MASSRESKKEEKENKTQNKKSKDAVIYTDFNGQEMGDPHKKIIHTNIKIIERDDYGSLIDYQVHDTEAEIFGAEMWGRRKTQEDSISFGLLEEFKGVTDVEAVLEQVPFIIQQIINVLELGDCGSTLCAVIIDSATSYTLNVGDSTAHRLSKENKDLRVKRLNDLHSPLNEMNRLNEKHVSKKDNRLVLNAHTTLSLSRSIGDNHYEEVGLIHKGEVSKAAISDDDYIIVACDGLTELRNSTDQERDELLGKIFLSLFQESNILSDKELAKKLAESAYNRGSGDNISVLFHKVNTANQMPRYMAVFDGHGGFNVSHVLYELFDLTLRNRLLLNKLAQKNKVIGDLLDKYLMMELECVKSLYGAKAFINLFNHHLLPAAFALKNEDESKFKEYLNEIRLINQVLQRIESFNFCKTPKGERGNPYLATLINNIRIYMEKEMQTDLFAFSSFSQSDAIKNFRTTFFSYSDYLADYHDIVSVIINMFNYEGINQYKTQPIVIETFNRLEQQLKEAAENIPPFSNKDLTDDLKKNLLKFIEDLVKIINEEKNKKYQEKYHHPLLKLLDAVSKKIASKKDKLLPRSNLEFK